jgi:23S rRNA pseudouridine2605 synthase
MTDEHEPEELNPEASEPEMQESAEAEPAEVAPESDEEEAAPAPVPQLERLQKILARAGVASRRHAEELITEGRVQVNGQVVSTLGAKADPARDHIRVDGKLLQGAERQRYFMLNKPKGYVTTVSDPEGRPTVMEFFAKMGERLYPVGRLDYLSEGLLLVTNDGELAHALTRAASGVEKTYLVKVAGQPAEEALERLRTGVAIERGKPGEGKVHTAPARIRQVRAGDNPWFEVVIIEGRNRELRKMFEEIGHHVEKIRRVGYGPLVLDLEPGKLRELDAEELAALRLTAEGKMKPRRMKTTAMLPKEARRPAGQRLERPADRGGKPARYGQNRPTRPATSRPYGDRPAAASGTSDFRPRKSFGADKPFRQARPAGGEFRLASGRGPERGPNRGPNRGPAQAADRGPARPAWQRDDRAARPSGPPSGRPPVRPAWKKDAGQGRGFAPRPGGGKPAWSKPSGERPAYNRPPNRPDSRTEGRPAAPRREAPAPDREFAPKRPLRLHIESVEPERPGARRPDRPAFDRPKFDRPRPDKPRLDKPRFEKPRSGTPRSGKPRFDKPRSDQPDFNRPRPDRPRPDRAGPEQSGTGRASTGRPNTGRTNTGGAGGSASSRGRSGLARPFTTSSGKPRAGGARPSSKPGGFSKPKSGFKGKSSGSGPGRGGPRPGGKQGPGGKRPGGGRKRG